MRGGWCTKSKITHISGCLPTGKQAEMESRLNLHSDRTLKTKMQGGCNEIEILGAHVMDYRVLLDLLDGLSCDGLSQVP